MINLRTSRIGFHVEKLIATSAGEELLSVDDRVREAVNNYAGAGAHADRLTDYDAFIGSVGRSNVYAIGDVAIKLSARNTGTGYWRDANTTRENLLDQFRFMNFLGLYLEEASDTISAPEQYFALKTDSGNYLSAYRYMRPWENVHKWTLHARLSTEEQINVYTATKQRIKSVVRHLGLQVGMSDLGLRDGNPLNAENVLVPIGQSLDPEQMPLCIIDQPSDRLHAQISRLVSFGVVSRAPFLHRLTIF